MSMADPNITKLIGKSFIAAIKNSVGANTWRNFYAVDHGTERDVLNDGVHSCSFFVSSITTIFGLSKSAHMTIDSTVNDLMECGWEETDEPRPGSVLLWEAQDFGAEGSFTHLGFYLGGEKAISASSSKHTPAEHDWLFRNNPPTNKTERKVEKILWHEKLAEEKA